MICFSPEDGTGRLESPRYVPVSETFAPITMGDMGMGAFSSDLLGGEDVLFGLGVQLPADPQVEEISDRVHRMDIDTTDTGDREGGHRRLRVC